MVKRGGGILDIKLIDKTAEEPGYYQIEARFETMDSMGANFINSCLESFANTLQNEIKNTNLIPENKKYVQVIMSILSNYTPECLVRAEVSCRVNEINEGSGISL